MLFDTVIGTVRTPPKSHVCGSSFVKLKLPSGVSNTTSSKLTSASIFSFKRARTDVDDSLSVANIV